VDYKHLITEWKGARAGGARRRELEIRSSQLLPKKREGPMIKKVEGGYKVLSEKGKNLGGPYKTKKEAEKRLKQVEFFKHKGK
jgi:hypothetical protein